MGSETRHTLDRPMPVETRQPAVRHRCGPEDLLFLDFGDAMFGTVEIAGSGLSGIDGLEIVLGEMLDREGRIETDPPGTIRVLRLAGPQLIFSPGNRLVIPSDPRNTGPAAIAMPESIGEVFPFRYVEIRGAGGLDAVSVRRVAVHIPFDETASAFSCSDETLNAIWKLCKHSIKATSFCGVYVDGDRERIPYEGDAYINQLCHYSVDRHFAMARYTLEHLIRFPTWPTDWQFHTVMMAWEDYLHTGDDSTLAMFYEDLKVKTLQDLARPDGLISIESPACCREFEERLFLHNLNYGFKHGLRDLVDWPPGSFAADGTGERDNHEMCPVNTVINAFHCHSLTLMAEIAAALGFDEESRRFTVKAAKVAKTMNSLLFDSGRGIYIDGEGSSHASLHSNMQMLAFGLVPPDRVASVLDFVISRGMACSVYGAQYLLEALYLNGAGNEALALMTARTDRSWWNMIRCGTTVTMEAWDLKYKKNLDWNHAWGAVPANIISRFILGVRPLDPGFARAVISPRPGPLTRVSGRVPTMSGPVVIQMERGDASCFRMDLEVPEGMTAEVGLPSALVGPRGIGGITVNGKPVTGAPERDSVIIGEYGPGEYRIEAVALKE